MYFDTDRTGGSTQVSVGCTTQDIVTHTTLVYKAILLVLSGLNVYIVT